MSLLVDIEDIPAVNLILVEGQLIFASPLNPAECNPNGYALDANYIFAFGGQIEIGNEDRPYECQLTITMHGARLDPEIPLFGNKVIAVRYGDLDIHGIPRTPYWT